MPLSTDQATVQNQGLVGLEMPCEAVGQAGEVLHQLAPVLARGGGADASPAAGGEPGIAYPVRARLSGEGVGAVRRCEFSTGAFVEPITVWSPPTHLAFDVREQPPTMTELSFYEHVLAPHLTSTFRSRRGEFRLIPEGPNRTRVEGTTWFTLDMEPAVYWYPMARALVHAIHLRVLEHIKRDAEAAR